jgi:hypothetical protein
MAKDWSRRRLVTTVLLPSSIRSMNAGRWGPKRLLQAGEGGAAGQEGALSRRGALRCAAPQLAPAAAPQGRALGWRPMQQARSSEVLWQAPDARRRSAGRGRTLQRPGPARSQVAAGAQAVDDGLCALELLPDVVPVHL